MRPVIELAFGRLVDVVRKLFLALVTWFALLSVSKRADMSVKLLSESMDATITDDDQLRIEANCAMVSKVSR